jgi:small conductance mechanosensitive channel
MKLIKLLFICTWFLAAGLGAQEETKDGGVPAVKTSLDHNLSLQEVELLVVPLTLEQLQAEADEWQQYVQDAVTEIANLKVAALSAKGEELEAIYQQLNKLTEERAATIAKLRLIIDSMTLKGAPAETTEPYRQYVKGMLASEFQATDIKTTLSQLAEWAASPEGGIGFGISVITVLGSVFVLIIIARFIRSLSSRGIRRLGHLSKLMQDFLLKTIFWLAFAIGLLIVLSFFGVNITPLFAVLGGASFILAFAMQETLGNLAAGLMIMINKPFDVGDLVDTNGILGEVEAVSIVSTTVRTLDNQVVILPNSAVWGSIITNVTVSPVRRVDMVFGIGYGDDMEKAQKILERVVSEHKLILDDPQPNIRVHELADSSVNFICRPWTKTEHYWDVYWDLTRKVKENFDAEGVSIPFPQRDVHLFQEPGS